jgi:hypothetical protein
VNGPDYAARAAAGAVFLDGQIPGWAGQVELATLLLSSECRCVLGQLSDGAGYHGMRDDLAIGMDAAVELGFALSMDDGWEDWAELDAAWAREIVTRREAAQAAS